MELKLINTIINYKLLTVKIITMLKDIILWKRIIIIL
jgi:hypothetical protein